MQRPRNLSLSVFRSLARQICHRHNGISRDRFALRPRYWRKQGRGRRLSSRLRQKPSPYHHRQPADIRLSCVRTHAWGSCRSPRTSKNRTFGRRRLSRASRVKRLPFQRDPSLTWSRNRPLPREDQGFLQQLGFSFVESSARPVLLHVFRDGEGLRRTRTLRHKAEGNQDHASEGAHRKAILAHFGKGCAVRSGESRHPPVCYLGRLRNLLRPEDLDGRRLRRRAGRILRMAAPPASWQARHMYQLATVR